MKKLGGWMKSSNRKQGYTIIELLVVMSISIVIFSVCLSILIKAVKDNQIDIENNIHLDNLDNCLINIDNLLHSSYITDISIENNKLVINMLRDHEINSKRRKEIYLKGSDLVVKTISESGSDITTGNNILLKSVSDFKVKKKKNLIYFTIVTKKGYIRTRCI